MDENRGTETPEPEILVVDDEAAVRQVLGVALQSAGFSVVLTSDGNEAVRLYQQHSGSIALVLLDVRMPAMDGPQTLAALRQFDPEVCCCFMSGEAGRYTEGELRERGGDRLLRKTLPPGGGGRGGPADRRRPPPGLSFEDPDPIGWGEGSVRKRPPRDLCSLRRRTDQADKTLLVLT